MQIKKILAPLFLITTIGFTQNTKSPQEIFEQKCQMCHYTKMPTTQEENRLMGGPTIGIVMKGLVITLDAMHDNLNDKMLKEKAVEFMADYIFYPERKKANCEDIVFERFNMMPSLKGYITKEELNRVLPWVYDTYKPNKIGENWVANQ